MLRAFWPLVPLHIKAKLDTVHTVQCSLARKQQANISWAWIVEVCASVRHSFAALAGITEDTAPATGYQAAPAVQTASCAPAMVRPRPNACFKVDTPCKLCSLIKRHAKEGSYVAEKTRPESHRFEDCCANPKNPEDFKVEVYRKRMRWLVENRVAIPEYMQPSLLRPADVQHCVAEGFMEWMAAPEAPAAPAQVTLPLPPQPPHPAVAAPTPMQLAPTGAADDGAELSWEEATDIIAAVRSRSEHEGGSSAADYDRFCREELARHGADVTHVPPPARPADPTLMYRHCKDRDDKQGADRLNTVVSTVVEDTFPQASLECKARLVEAWEKVMGSCPKVAA